VWTSHLRTDAFALASTKKWSRVLAASWVFLNFDGTMSGSSCTAPSCWVICSYAKASPASSPFAESPVRVRPFEDAYALVGERRPPSRRALLGNRRTPLELRVSVAGHPVRVTPLPGLNRRNDWFAIKNSYGPVTQVSGPNRHRGSRSVTSHVAISTSRRGISLSHVAISTSHRGISLSHVAISTSHPAISLS